MEFFTDGLISGFSVLIQRFFCAVKHSIPFRTKTLETAENGKFLHLAVICMKGCSIHTFFRKALRHALA